MSIFLDPSVDRRVVGAATQTLPLPRNECGPVDGCPTCAPLPHVKPAGCEISNPGCIIVSPAGVVTSLEGDTSECSDLRLQQQLADNTYLNSVAAENLNLGGADACFYKMLGVQQQGTLVDAAGYGQPIADSHKLDFPPDNAFDRFASFWCNGVVGQASVGSWVGYDFGVVKRATGLQMYSNEAEAEARKHITSFAIKQAGTSDNWAKRVRIERSDNGIQWRGVDVVTLPQNTERTVIYVKRSVPARMWRLRLIDPVASNWQVETLELYEFSPTDLSILQDSPLFQENRDRSYCINPVHMKIFYDLVNISTELSRFGIDLPTATLTCTVSFAQAVKNLGRGVVIGDVLEIPSELQFTYDMKIVRKFVEVTDVTWSTKGYTPGWTPLFQQITAKPMLARQEVMDIIGSLESNITETGDGYQSDEVMFSELAMQANEQIQIAADSMVQQLGQDEQTVADITEIPLHQRDTADAYGININKLVSSYIDDNRYENKTYRTAMPPAGTAQDMFTSGDHAAGFPSRPKNGQYHRMSYDSVSTEKIPPKLYRYSTVKSRWIYLESDDRYAAQTNKTKLKSFLTDDERVDISIPR